MIGTGNCLMRHHRAFAVVPVAAGSHHCGHETVLAHDVANCVEHVHEGVGSVGIVDDSRHVVASADCLEAAVDRYELAHVDENLFLREAREYRGSVDGGKVIGVETAREAYLHLMVVEHQEGAVETGLQDAATEVGVAAERISIYLGLGVLDHIAACLIVDVD